ncbi:MAG: hypothetical protein GY765_24450 [bacterium]|nr:hypothetical protein [bacterium]
MKHKATDEPSRVGEERGEDMKAGELIPVKKEFTFLFKIAAVMVVSAAAALTILHLFLDKDVGASYQSAFKLLAETHDKMNFYIVIAVLVQLVFSSLLVYFISLYFSHKIAGPVYRLRIVLQQYIDGEDIKKVSFRDTDFIPGVSKMFTKFLNFMGERKTMLEEAEQLARQLNAKETPEADRRNICERLQGLVAKLER